MQTPNPKVPPVPEMVGATSAPFYLGKFPTYISLPVHAPTGPALLHADPKLRRVYLSIENITSNERAPSYVVYLNLPPGDEPGKRPDLRAGVLAMFGLEESSRADGEHPGNGLTYSLDVTELFARLAAARDWDARSLRVHFVPRPWDGAVKVQIGRVSLYFE